MSVPVRIMMTITIIRTTIRTISIRIIRIRISIPWIFLVSPVV